MASIDSPFTRENNACSIINSNPLDTVAIKNLEGLKYEKRRKQKEKEQNRELIVFNYLAKKLPHGDVKLELIHSLPRRAFSKFLIQARLSSIWRIFWPGTTMALTLAFAIVLLFGEAYPKWLSDILLLLCAFLYFSSGLFFAHRLLSFSDNESLDKFQW